MVRSSMLEEMASIILPFGVLLGFLWVSCSLPTKCFAQDWAPTLCIPLIAAAEAAPVRYGSGEKPSQFRPPSACLPKGPATGLGNTLDGDWGGVRSTNPKAIFAPLPLNSLPISIPRW